MRNMCMAMALALAASACAAEGPAAEKLYPVPPDKMAEFNAKTGGMIDPPPGGKALVLLDAREKDSSTLSNLLFAAELQLAISCEERDIRLAATLANTARELLEKPSAGWRPRTIP